jgi:hypothetical protein
MVTYIDTNKASENIIAYDLQKAQIPARQALDELVKNTTAPVEGKKPEELFDAIFDQAVAALDEVYERYLLEDFKKVQINEIYALTDDIADRYSIYDDAQDDDLIAALRQYLTAEDTTAGAAITGFDKVDMLKAGVLVTKFATYEVPGLGELKEMPDFSKDYTEVYGDIADDVAAAKLVLWEMAIMDNFDKYLLNASTNLDAAYKAYTSIDNLDSSRVYKLHAVYTEQAEDIAEVKRQENIGAYTFAGDGSKGYIEAYKKLLGVVATESLENHLIDLYGEDNTWAAELSEILSSGEDVADYDQDSIYRLYQPAAYEYVGGAVRGFDKAVNEYAMDNNGTRLY